MTYPWSSGDVLTAADLNAYAGLVLVKTQTIGSGVSSVTVTNAFSSTFDSYRVVIYIDSATSSGELKIRFNTVATGYYGTLYYDSYAGSSGSVRQNNGNALDVALTELSNGSFSSIDISQPATTERPYIHGTYNGRGFSGWFGGVLNNSAQYANLLVFPSAGLFNGGTIRVYGYNNG
jgi:hypothetical protein